MEIYYCENCGCKFDPAENLKVDDCYDYEDNYVIGKHIPFPKSQEYSYLKKEVESYRDEIKSELIANELYNGCRILYSPLKENPLFLFIGINPNFMNEERRDEKEDLEPIKFDYLDEGNSNQLVTGTRQI